MSSIENPVENHRGLSPTQPVLFEIVESVAGENRQSEEDDPITIITGNVRPEDVNKDTLEHLIDQHPEVHQMTSELKFQRETKPLSQDEEQKIVGAIKSKRQEVGHAIKEKLGIIEESPQALKKRLEMERLRALGGILSSLTGNENDDELLVKYGLTDEDGNMTNASMNSPLFKGDTRHAFHIYMNYARQFDILEMAEAAEGHALKNTLAASNLRGKAHNIVAKLVERDLGLRFDAARRFVAKARDAVTPGLHEKTNYAGLLRGQKLAEQFGHDALIFTEESLKTLIDEPMDFER